MLVRGHDWGELPKQIVKATPFLAALERDVRDKLVDKRVLITFPMRDRAFPAATTLPRMRDASRDVHVEELPHAKHFFVEDAPCEVASAIVERHS